MDMKESRLANAMQYLDEDLIAQAEEYMPLYKKWYQSAWIKWGVMAAGLLLVVSAIPTQQGSYASHTSSLDNLGEMNVLPNIMDHHTIGDYVPEIPWEDAPYGSEFNSSLTMEDPETSDFLENSFLKNVERISLTKRVQIKTNTWDELMKRSDALVRKGNGR